MKYIVNNVINYRTKQLARPSEHGAHGIQCIKKRNFTLVLKCCDLITTEETDKKNAAFEDVSHSGEK